jgi:hypothetical protein
MADQEEDDYLSMTFTDDKPKETSLQRTARLKKESLERGRPKSKAELAAQEKLARETALATAIDDSNKGAKMMAKMGFKGGALGKSEDARTQPIELLMKDDRGGIGMDSEKKRKIREAAEEAEGEAKRKKVELEEFRDAKRVEREEKRAEGMWWGAMKVLEGFEDEAAEGESDGKPAPKRYLRDTSVLARPVLKQRLEKERDRKMRYDLNNSLSMRNDSDSENDTAKDKAFDKRADELDDPDPELERYEALSFMERLEKVVHELREKYQYCFYCKFRYPDAEMEGCPGLTEDEHG